MDHCEHVALLDVVYIFVHPFFYFIHSVLIVYIASV